MLARRRMARHTRVARHGEQEGNNTLIDFAARPRGRRRAPRRGDQKVGNSGSEQPARTEAPARTADEMTRRTSRLAYAALGWVVLFFAFHVYWYAGGSFASPGALPPLVPHSLGGWIFAVPVVSAFPVGAVVCLAIARGWPRGRMRRLATGLVVFGCVLLVVRGGAGEVDDVVRATGLLHNGLSGLTLAQMGTAQPSSAQLWSGYAIDVYFCAGGLIFWLLAVHYRRSTRGHLDASLGPVPPGW